MLHIFYITAVLALGAYAHARFFPRLMVEFRDVEGHVKKDISVAEAALKSRVLAFKKKL